MKKQKGITLIALIITIIILLILAGVVLNSIIGNGSIIGKSQEAVDKYNGAVTEEKEIINTISKYFEQDGITEELIEDFKANPDKYTYDGQDDNNKDRAIGTDGKPVNMDLWSGYTIVDGEAHLDGTSVGSLGGFLPLYAEDQIENGKIKGTVPQYIYSAENNQVYTVVSMVATFYKISSLVEAPVIPNTVTNIGKIFYDNTALTKAPTIPEGVTSMDYTFYGCSSLAEAPVIPEGVASLYSTFCGCSSLTKASEIPYGVTDMGYAFYRCSSLTEAPAIPNSVTSLYYTFCGCSKLTKAPTIPESVGNMESTFANCTLLVEAPTILGNVYNMRCTFQGCTSLINAPEIPSSVTDMMGTFSGCTSLGEVHMTIPEGVIYLGHSYGSALGTFYNCSALTGTITINIDADNFNAHNSALRECFAKAATNEDCDLVLNGTSSLLSSILSTKSSNSNIRIEK